MGENEYIIMTWQKFCDLAHIDDSIHGYAEVDNVVGNYQTQRELEQLLKKHFVFDDKMKKEFDEANKSAREKFASDTLSNMRKAKITSIISDAKDGHQVEFIDLISEFLNMTIDEISKMEYDGNFSSRERSRARDVYYWLQPENFSLIVAQLPSEYKQIEEILEAVKQNAFKNDTHNQDLFKGMFEGGYLDINPDDSSIRDEDTREDIRTILTKKIDIIDSCILLICSEEQNQKWNETKQRHWHGKGKAKSPRNHIIDDLLKKKGKVDDHFKSGDSIGKQLAFCWAIRDDENFKLKWLKDKPSITEAKEAMFQCELYVHKLPLLLGELREKGLDIPEDINEQFVQNQQVLVKKIAQLNQRQESDIEEVISQAIEEIEKKHKNQFDLFTRNQREKTIGSDDIDNYVKGFIERNFGETCSALLESGIEAYEGGNISCQDGIKTRLGYAEQAIKVRAGFSKPRDIVDSYKDSYEGINDKPGLFFALGMECISMSFDPENVDADDLEIYDFKAAATYESVIEQDILGIRQKAFNRYKKALEQNRSEVGKLTHSYSEYSEWSQMLERLYKENPEDVKREQMKLLDYAAGAMNDRFKQKQQVVTDSRIIDWIQEQQGYPFCKLDSTDLSDLLTAEIKVEETWNKLKQSFPGDFEGITLDTKECNSQNELIKKLIILTDKDEKKIKERIDEANSAIKRRFYAGLRSRPPKNEQDIIPIRENLLQEILRSGPEIDIKKLRDALNEHPDSLKKGLTIPLKRKLPYEKMQPDNDKNRMRLDQYVYSEPSDIQMLLQKCSQLFPEGMNKSDITEIKKTIQLEHEDFNKFCSQYRKKLQEFGIPSVSIQMLDFSFIYSQCKSKEMLYGQIQADKEKYGLEISEFQKRKDMQYHRLYMLESRYKKKIPIDSDDISIINSLGNSISVPVFELLTTEEQNRLKSRASQLLPEGERFDDENDYHMMILYQMMSDDHEKISFLKKHINVVFEIYSDRLYDCLVEIFQKGNANDQNLEFLAQIISIMNQGYCEKPLRIQFKIPEEEIITKDDILNLNPQIKQWYDVQKSEAVQGTLPTDHEDYDNLIKAAITGNQISKFDSFFTNKWDYKKNDTIKELAIQQARRGHTYFAKKLMYFNEIHQALSDRPDIVSQMIDEAFTKDDHDFIIAITAKAMLEFKPSVLTEEVENYEDRIKYAQLKNLYHIQRAIRTHRHYKGLTEDINSFNDSDEKKDIAKAIAYIAFESKNDDFFKLIYPNLTVGMRIAINEEMANSASDYHNIIKILIENSLDSHSRSPENNKKHVCKKLKGINKEHIINCVTQEARNGNLTLAQKMLTFSEITDKFDTQTINKMIHKAFQDKNYPFIKSITAEAILNLDNTEEDNYADMIEDAELKKLYQVQRAIRTHDCYDGLAKDIFYLHYNNSFNIRGMAKVLASVAFEYKNDDFFNLIYPNLSRNMKDQVLIAINEKMELSAFYSYPNPITIILGHAIEDSKNATKEFHFNNTLRNINQQHIKSIVIQEAKKGNLSLAQKMLTFSEITDELDTATVNKMIAKAFREKDNTFINNITDAAMLEFVPPEEESDSYKKPYNVRNLLAVADLGKNIREQKNIEEIDEFMNSYINNTRKSKQDIEDFLSATAYVACKFKCEKLFTSLFEFTATTDILGIIKRIDSPSTSEFICTHILPSFFLKKGILWDPTIKGNGQIKFVTRSSGGRMSKYDRCYYSLDKREESWTISASYCESMTRKIIEEGGKYSQKITDWLAQRACESNNPDDFHETFACLPDDEKYRLIKLFCSSDIGYGDKRLSFTAELLKGLGENLAMKEINPLTQMHSDFFTTADFNRELKIAESIWLPRYWSNQYPKAIDGHDVYFPRVIKGSIFSPIIFVIKESILSAIILLLKWSFDILPLIYDCTRIVLITMCLGDPTREINELKKLFREYANDIKPIIDLVKIIVLIIPITLTSIIPIINFFLRYFRLKNRDSIYTITRDKALKESNTSKKVQYAYNFLGLVSGLQNKGITNVEKIRKDIEKIINSIPRDCNYIVNLNEKSREIIESLCNSGASEAEQRLPSIKVVEVQHPSRDEDSRHTRPEWRNLIWPDAEEDPESLEALSKQYPDDDGEHNNNNDQNRL